MELLGENMSAVPVRIIVLLTMATVIPGILLSMTAFLRIVLVFGFLRHALGLQQMPPNQVVIGLSLFLTYFVMGDVFDRAYQGGVRPYLDGQMKETTALEGTMKPIREFMLTQSRPTDLDMMANVVGVPENIGPTALPLRVVAPAFIVSELRAAFSIGFLLFVPFLVIDLAVAAMLNALGMIMLPPTAISLPFKLMVFVLSDGWSLLVGALSQSFGG